MSDYVLCQESRSWDWWLKQSSEARGAAVERLYEEKMAEQIADWPFTSYSTSLTIVGNTPTTGGKLSEQNWQDWLKSIPDPVEVV